MAVKGEGSPVKTETPVWWIFEVFPCIGLPARTISPPYAAPIAWWPRQTPKIGMRGPKRRMASTETPASVGVQFHPESVLTEYGYRMLDWFLTGGRTPNVPDRADQASVPSHEAESDLSTSPPSVDVVR